MSETPTASPAASFLACPECGRQFSRSQALGIHRRQVHGVIGKSKKSQERRALQGRKAGAPAPAQPAALPDEVRALVAPIEAQANHVRAQLANVEAEREQLLATLRRFDGAIRALTGEGKGKPGPKPGAKNTHGRPPLSGAKFKQVEAYIDGHAGELADGFTCADLDRRMRDNGHAGPPISTERVRQAIDVLHERGVLRLDRMVKGGGKLYKLTGGESRG